LVFGLLYNPAVEPSLVDRLTQWFWPGADRLTSLGSGPFCRAAEHLAGRERRRLERSRALSVLRWCSGPLAIMLLVWTLVFYGRQLSLSSGGGFLYSTVGGLSLPYGLMTLLVGVAATLNGPLPAQEVKKLIRLSGGLPAGPLEVHWSLALFHYFKGDARSHRLKVLGLSGAHLLIGVILAVLSASDLPPELIWTRELSFVYLHAAPILALYSSAGLLLAWEALLPFWARLILAAALVAALLSVWLIPDEGSRLLIAALLPLVIAVAVERFNFWLVRLATAQRLAS